MVKVCCCCCFFVYCQLNTVAQHVSVFPTAYRDMHTTTMATATTRKKSSESTIRYLCVRCFFCCCSISAVFSLPCCCLPPIQISLGLCVCAFFWYFRVFYLRLNITFCRLNLPVSIYMNGEKKTTSYPFRWLPKKKDMQMNKCGKQWRCSTETLHLFLALCLLFMHAVYLN